ncbi:MAG: hypothetical protein GX847_06400 [Clostridiales bacterium]|nr:hypothetical protein [Clostridiales bacterium]
MSRDNYTVEKNESVDNELLSAERDNVPDIDNNKNDALFTSDGYSLESILAEYKGSAYIAGDKKTPPTVLQEKTDKIMLEAAGGKAEKVKAGTGTLREDSISQKKATAVHNTDEIRKTHKRNIRNGKESDSFESTDKTAASDTVRFGTDRDNADNEYDNYLDDIGREVSAAIDKQTQIEDESKKSVRRMFGIFNRQTRADEDRIYDDDEAVFEEPVPVVEEEVFEEPDYRTATKTFAERCNSYSIRSFVSLVITVVMAILTLLFESDAALPFGLGQNKILSSGILLMLLLVVMMLSIDKLFIGIVDIFRRGPNIESLNLFSCLAVIAAAAYGIYQHDTSTGMPYCVISAFSLTFMLWAEKVYYRAMTESMKTAQAASVPSGVIAEMSIELDSTIIKRVSGRTAGFYNNLIQADISETAYKYAAPMLIVASVVLAVYASFGHGRSQYFLHYLAAIMAAAAPFSAAFAYAVPFSAVTRRARQLGAAIAGWGGADELFHTDGVSITDEDLFPAGTVSIAGIKVFEEVHPEKAIRYTGSLIVASNSGLTKLFSQQLKKQAMPLMRVEEFACYEGGIGGVIKGERVITGSAAFMNLMGIRVPASLNMKNAVFTAINKRLIAVFAINYVPIKSVQNALISVLRYRVKLFFAVRDFNITPVMLEQKFKVPVNDVEYMPIQNTYELSDSTGQEARRVSAVLTREGMGPYVESITGSRRLWTTALTATIFSILSACAGMLIMFTICWAGSFSAARAGNLLLYMLSMLFVTFIICGFAKYRQ